jgi:hypothetical protein
MMPIHLERWDDIDREALIRDLDKRLTEELRRHGMPRPGPSAICLECWREGIVRIIDPVGYFNVPCLRHYDDSQADKPPRPITAEDLK